MSLLTGLEAYYKLADVSDSHGSNTLTNNGSVTFAAGKVGNGADFEAAGNNQSLSRADNASLSTGDIDFTVDCWVKLESKPSTLMIVAGKHDGAGTHVEWLLYWDNADDRFKFVVYTAGAASSTTVIASSFGAPSTGTWYYICAKHDATNNLISISVNDGTVDDEACSHGSNNSDADFVIGRIGTGFPFDGMIDELGFWKKVLSTAEITARYNSGTGNTYEDFFDPRVATDYYIDATGGSDLNDGTLGNAWQTSAAANSRKFSAGDRLFLNRGDEFDPLLIQLAAGGSTPNSGATLTIGAYGSGANPIVNAGVAAYGIRVLNLPYTIIEDIEVFGATVTFTPGSPNTVSYTNTGYGIHFHNTSAAQLSGCIVRRCEVHGVQDGIVLGDLTSVQTNGYDDFEISDNEVHGCTVRGITIANGSSYTPTHFNDGVITENYVYNIYGNWTGVEGDNTGYPIQIPASTGVLVYRNTVKDSGAASSPEAAGGPTGIIGAGTHNSIIRGNVVLNQSTQSVDGAGIHMDGNGCVDNVIECNYVAGCVEGMSLLNVGGATSGTIVRHNVIQDSTLKGFRIFGATGSIFHDNTVYSSTGDLFYCEAAFEGYNNILITVGGDLGQVAAATELNGNLYDCSAFSLTYNGNARASLAALQSNDSQEADGIATDADLEDAGNGPTTWTDPDVFASSVTAYDPLPGSAAIGAGLDLQALYAIDPGTIDFHGRAIASWDGFNIGAVESSSGGGNIAAMLVLGVI